jgi:tRNA threonylcarbamoyladenosine biosynthesis protein TsaB
MALILNIDTAIDSASLCIAKDAMVLATSKNEMQKDQAAWIHNAIKKLFEEKELEIKTVDAIAVTGGPGSYTGLRIGMATAKGICYALNKPLINLNTLQAMANGATKEKADLLCPMIDARRMEVFTAIYSKDLQTVIEPTALLIDERSFEKELAENSICFFGNGSTKFKNIIQNKNALFSEITHNARNMVSLSEEKFRSKEFADLAYTEPLYLKEFYTPPR